MPTLKQLETALINADAAGDEEAARAIAAEIKRVRAAQGKEEPGRLASAAKGALYGAANVLLKPFEWAAEGLDYLGAPGAKDVAARSTRDKASTQQALAPYIAAHPNWFAGGQIAGEIAATAPIMGAVGQGVARAGGLVAKVAPKVGQSIARVGRAVETGGIGAGRTAAQTAKLGKVVRAGQLAERMVGGAVSGAGGAALADQDVGSGAAFGAALPVVATMVRRVAGKTVDLTKLPQQKAAQIIREALGEDMDAARAAFAELSPNDQRLARQVLVDAGVEPRVFIGLGADVERMVPDEVARTLEDQARARAQRLAQAGGGATATERRGAAELGRRSVNVAAGPLRDTALERANVAGRVVPEAERLADAARARADELTASGFVPRMRGLESRSREQIDAVFQNPAFFTESRPVVRAGEIADSAGQRADDAIAAQLRLRDQARDMEDVVADLAAEGMQPLRVAPIVRQLRNMAGQPGTRADQLQRNTMVRLANQLEKLADANGVIDARDLYQLRKTGVNDIVDRLLGARTQPGSGTKERTAGLLTSTRQMIDDAIKSAGGDTWGGYLTRTRQGFEAVNRQELGAKGAQLAQENPNEFIALMRGERPQMVEDIMGKGTKQYDIGGMALADPERYLALKQSADELSTLNRMSELGRQGSKAAFELAYRERPSILTRGLTGMALFPSAPARIGVQGAEMVLSSYMAPRVQQELSRGFLTGQNAMALMNRYPTSFNMSEQLSRLSPAARNALVSTANKMMTSEFPEIDPETGMVLVGVGETPDGQPYPMYGKPSANINSMMRLRQ